MMGNIDKVQIVARALGEIKEQVVFVGGSVVELYADNPELPTFVQPLTWTA